MGTPGSRDMGRARVVLQLGAGGLEVERVEAVPLLGGDLLADVAGVFARGDEQREDRGAGFDVEGEAADEVVGVALPLDVFGVVEGMEDTLPAVLGGGGGLVEHEVEVDVEQAGGVLGTLEVAGHPVERVGDA